MDMLTTDISSLGYKAVKEKVDKIDVNEVHNSEDLIKIIDILKADKRKNINSLGNKLQRAKDKIESEIKRVREMYNFDKSFGDFQVVAGVDEVGRGPLAGPVAAGAVILPKDCLILYLNDSKKLSEKRREELFLEIKEKALAWSVGIATPQRIDEINILQATYEAMREAIKGLGVEPGLLLNDAVTIPGVEIPQIPIVKGDAKSVSIAAASILAKVTRDHMMAEYDEIYPGYGFGKHKGYGTKAHIEALKELGPCPIHRRSFIGHFVEV